MNSTEVHINPQRVVLTHSHRTQLSRRRKFMQCDGTLDSQLRLQKVIQDKCPKLSYYPFTLPQQTPPDLVSPTCSLSDLLHLSSLVFGFQGSCLYVLSIGLRTLGSLLFSFQGFFLLYMLSIRHPTLGSLLFGFQGSCCTNVTFLNAFLVVSGLLLLNTWPHGQLAS